jgi:hypothetical protein
MEQYVYSIPYECGRSYTGETGRPLAMQLHEHRHNKKEGLLENQNSSTCLQRKSWGRIG